MRQDQGGKQEWQLTSELSLRAPIVQASLGGFDGPRLAGAVSRAGGLGCLTVRASDDTVLRHRLRRVRAITPRPHLVAFISQWQRDSLLGTCLAEGVGAFYVFWWNGPRLAPRIRNAGAAAFWQVGSASEAEDALNAGASVLVAQGTDAGGQVRSPHLLPDLIADLRARFPDAPIVAGGGLATRSDVQNVLGWGANAALLGTRFLLSEEAHVSNHYKVRLLRATSEQLLLDPEMVGDWPCAPRRRLLTRYGDQASLFAGAGLSHISTLLSAREIVRRLTPQFPKH